MMRTIKQLWNVVKYFAHWGDGYEAHTISGRPVDLTPEEVELMCADIDQTMQASQAYRAAHPDAYTFKKHGRAT